MQLGNKPVRGCIACGQCQAKQLGCCVFDDDICNRIVEKLNEADALIVGSPVYYGQPNGAVMAVLQRAFFSGAKVQNKPAATCCRMSSWWCYGSLSDAEHDIRDDEHAHSDLTILEHRLRQDARRSDTRHRGYADHAHISRQHGMAAEEDSRQRYQPDYPEREEWQGMNFIR